MVPTMITSGLGRLKMNRVHLDRSGAMEPRTRAAISEFNVFHRTQQTAAEQVHLTLILFNDESLRPVDKMLKRKI